MRLSLTGILDLEYDAPDHLAKSIERAMRAAFDPDKSSDPFGFDICKIKIEVMPGVEYTATVLGFKIDNGVAVGIDLD